MELQINSAVNQYFVMKENKKSLENDEENAKEIENIFEITINILKLVNKLFNFLKDW